jgi:hypothetical protein
MKNLILLIVFYLGIWGILGFFVTIAFSFLACCFGLSEEFYVTSLVVFGILAVAFTTYSVVRKFLSSGQKPSING